MKMCGPRDVALDSPTVTTAGGEATGQDKSSAAGIFVLTVEHGTGAAVSWPSSSSLPSPWRSSGAALGGGFPGAAWRTGAQGARNPRATTPVAKAVLEHLGGFPHWPSLNESFCCVLPFFLFRRSCLSDPLFNPIFGTRTINAATFGHRSLQRGWSS